MTKLQIPKTHVVAGLPFYPWSGSAIRSKSFRKQGFPADSKAVPRM